MVRNAGGVCVLYGVCACCLWVVGVSYVYAVHVWCAFMTCGAYCVVHDVCICVCCVCCVVCVYVTTTVEPLLSQAQC